jgi:hypothetical protein
VEDTTRSYWGGGQQNKRGDGNVVVASVTVHLEERQQENWKAGEKGRDGDVLLDFLHGYVMQKRKI